METQNDQKREMIAEESRIISIATDIRIHTHLPNDRMEFGRKKTWVHVFWHRFNENTSWSSVEMAGIIPEHCSVNKETWVHIF